MRLSSPPQAGGASNQASFSPLSASIHTSSLGSFRVQASETLAHRRLSSCSAYFGRGESCDRSNSYARGLSTRLTGGLVHRTWLDLPLRKAFFSTAASSSDSNQANPSTTNGTKVNSQANGEGGRQQNDHAKTNQQQQDNSDYHARRAAMWFLRWMGYVGIAAGTLLAYALYNVPVHKPNPTLSDRFVALVRTMGAIGMGVIPIPGLNMSLSAPEEEEDERVLIERFGSDNAVVRKIPILETLGISDAEREMLERADIFEALEHNEEEAALKKFIFQPEAPIIDEPLTKTVLLSPIRAVRTTIHFMSYVCRLIALAIRFGPVFLAYPVLRGTIWIGCTLGIGAKPAGPSVAALPVVVNVVPDPNSLDTDAPIPLDPDEPLWAQRLTDLWWIWLTHTLEEAGPTFVKLGQFASTRQDIFSPAICQRLGRLREATMPHDWSMTENSLREMLGPDWDRYIYISEEDRRKPVGSGCIAQVYRGHVYVAKSQKGEPTGLTKLPDDGAQALPTGAPIIPLYEDETPPEERAKEIAEHPLDHFTHHHPHHHHHHPLHPVHVATTDAGSKIYAQEVALKVLHPHAQWSITKDLRLLNALARFAESIPFIQLHWASPVDMMHEFSRLMVTQLDLTIEADNLRTFANNFKDDLKTNANFTVVFPEVVLARPALLVETFCRGLPIGVLLNSAFDFSGCKTDAQDLNDAARNPEDYELVEPVATDKLLPSAGKYSPATTAAKRMFKGKIPGNTSKVFLDHISTLDNVEMKELKRQIAACGLNAFLRMLFDHGFFHADLHPGNIIVDLGAGATATNGHGHPAYKPQNAMSELVPGLGPIVYWVNIYCEQLAKVLSNEGWMPFPSLYAGVFSNDPAIEDSITECDGFGVHSELVWRPPIASDPTARHLILIDAGMSTRLSARDRQNISDLFFYVGSGQGDYAAQLMIDRAPPDRRSLNRTPEQREAFIREVGRIVNDAASVGFSLSSMSIVQTLTALLAAARNYHVKLETSFISVIVAVTVIEGVGRSLDPEINIIAPALSILAKSRIKAIKKKLARKLKEKEVQAETASSDEAADTSANTST